MLSLGRNWEAGAGPLALLACPPGERHDPGLIAFPGSETPIEIIVDDDLSERLGAAALEADPARGAAQLAGSG